MPRADMTRFVGQNVAPVASSPTVLSKQGATELAAADSRPKARITFDVDEETHRLFKSWCSLNKTSIKKYLTEYINQTLQDGGK